MGTFFVLPVYLQVVLGFDAFETGKQSLPDVGIDAGRSACRAEGGSSIRASNRRSGRPRRNGDRGARAGRDDRGDAQRDGICGVARVLWHRRRAADVTAWQRDHVLVSAGGYERGGRAPGNGTELRRVTRHRPDRLRTAAGPPRTDSTRGSRTTRPCPPTSRHKISKATEAGIPIVTTDQAYKSLRDAGLSQAHATTVTADYADAQLDALKTSMLAVALLAVLSFWFTRRLPWKTRAGPVELRRSATLGGF